MLRVGIIGLGFMGWIHWLAWQRVRGVKVTAVCDPKPKRIKGDWRGIRGNFGPPGKKVDLAGVAGYLDWRELLKDPSIDLVDITLPTHLHAEVATAALAAGKHVLCEKPMALSSRDCRRMIRAAERAKRMLFIAHVLPFFPEYAWALKATRSGRYGEVTNAWLKRMISEPTWMANYWSPEKIGGPLFDLHVHDAHFARLLCGMPTSVKAAGTLRDKLPEAWTWEFNYANRTPVVRGASGVRDGGEWTFNHGFTIAFERRMLTFDFVVIDGQGKYVPAPVSCGATGNGRPAKLKGGDPLDAFTAELREAARCIRTGIVSEILSSQIAGDAVRICEAEARSIVRGKTVRLSR